jgi:hypothetical protein
VSPKALNHLFRVDPSNWPFDELLILVPSSLIVGAFARRFEGVVVVVGSWSQDELLAILADEALEAGLEGSSTSVCADAHLPPVFAVRQQGRLSPLHFPLHLHAQPLPAADADEMGVALAEERGQRPTARRGWPAIA